MDKLSFVERQYQAHLDSLSGQERVVRCCSLFDSMVAMLAHQILREDPGLSQRELRLRIAEILYLSDEGAQKLLRRARQRDQSA